MASGYVWDETSSAATDASAPYDDSDWSNIGNIYLSDANYGSVLLPYTDIGIVHYSYRVKCKGFDFSSIPATATITGAYCQAELHRSGGSADISLLQLLDTSGNPTGTNQYAVPGAISNSVPSYISVGGDGSMWGCALTVGWVQNANFGVAFGVEGADDSTVTVYMDCIGLGIHYTYPDSGGARAFVQSWIRPTIISGS